MEDKKINVEITSTEIKSLLMRHLDIKQSDRVADVIVGHMSQTGNGISQLFKSFMGIFPTTEYKIGDMLWIRLNAIHAWKYDMVLTKALPNVQQDHILAQVKDIDVYQSYPYTVSIDAIKTGTKSLITDTASISEIHIIEKAEDFTDILDNLEKLRDEDDLPF